MPIEFIKIGLELLLQGQRTRMAWYVRRLCSRVSDHMAHDAMTPAEPHVQQASSDPTQGDESPTLPVLHGIFLSYACVKVGQLRSALEESFVCSCVTLPE